jgi:hypothetical protein
MVGDVVAGGDGLLYVLDFGAKHLVVATRGGTLLQVVGQVGRGPGEFVEPVRLASTKDAVYLLDRGNQRVEMYRAGAGGLKRTGSLALDFVPEDFCTMGERLFVLGGRGGYLLHEVSPRDGRVLRSLVASPASDDPMLSPYYGSGYIQCGPGDEVTVLPLLRPEISRYSAATGRRLGQVRIPGFNETRVSRARGSMVYTASEGRPADYASSLVRLEGGRLLVQVGPIGQGASRHEFTSLRSFVLSWDEGSLIELAPTLPRIMAVDGRTAVAVHTDPFPALSLIPLPLGDVPHEIS